MTGQTDFTKSNAEISERNKFLARVYGWMTAALALSGFTAYYTANNPTLIKMIFGNGYGFFILALAEIAVVWILSRTIRRISVAGALFAFITYSVLNGLTLSSIFFYYTGAVIARVFFISAILFAVMTIYGITTKSDIRSAGRYLMMALIGIIIASLVNIFMRSSMLDWIISIVTVVVFSGLTAYDANKMMTAANRANGNDMFKKAAIIGALELYIDFINIFLSLLRIFGRGRD